MNDRDQILLEKAERILKSNMYTDGDYQWGKYRMISPTMGYFRGVWNWDSAFHAIGMIDFDTEIAKEQITGFLQFQQSDGMLPDVVWEAGGMVLEFTKPPVMAYAALEVFKSCNDLDFLKEVYPKLALNERFWTSKRMYNGLFHYDADSTGCDMEAFRRRVGNESGWDNSPRWDGEPQNLWAIDLNCYMVMTYRALSEMAQLLGLDDEEWSEKEAELTEMIEKRLWNDEVKAYMDYDFKAKRFSTVLSPASFMPLFTETAPKERAEAMNRIAEEHFLPGMPSVAYDDPEYTPKKYWRGRCWLNVAYFAAKGLKNYGFAKSAETVKNTILDWVYRDGEFIHENYNAETGEGLSSSNFSWSCVFVRKFIKEF